MSPRARAQAQLADIEAAARAESAATIAERLRTAVFLASDLYAATMGNQPIWDNREHMRRYIADAVIDRILHPAETEVIR